MLRIAEVCYHFAVFFCHCAPSVQTIEGPTTVWQRFIFIYLVKQVPCYNMNVGRIEEGITILLPLSSDTLDPITS